MKWQSEEHVGLAEAAEWARHFGALEGEMDHLLGELFGVADSEVNAWIAAGRYVSGRELAAAGLADLIDVKTFRVPNPNGTMPSVKSTGSKRLAAAPSRKRRERKK
jgi:hypothetical protein